MFSVGICERDISDFEWRYDNTVQFIVTKHDPPRGSTLLQKSGISIALI